MHLIGVRTLRPWVLGWVSALFVALGAACGEVEHCERGAVGCIDGPPNDAGVCSFDLIARGNVCVAKGASDRPTGPQPNPCGKCAKGLTCTSDSLTCVDFCESVKPLPGSEKAPDPIRCGGEIKDNATGETYSLSFDETCFSNCQLACRLRDWFCKSGCAKGACDAPEVLADCHARCDDATDPLTCIESVCTDTRATGCSSVEGFCEGGEIADCSATECKNSCASTAYDGVCDDGDLFSAAFGSCAWGSDCADCGPREGDDISHDLKQGAACSLQEQCAGYSPDFAKNAAFCAQVVPGKPLRRCVLDCSGDTELCPLGTTCSTLRAEKPEGGTTPVFDVNKVRGRACLPDACL